jgi:hypothetical protein
MAFHLLLMRHFLMTGCRRLEASEGDAELPRVIDCLAQEALMHFAIAFAGVPFCAGPCQRC